MKYKTPLSVRAVKHAVLLLVTLLFGFPMFYIILTSVKDGDFVFQHYRLLDFSRFSLSSYFSMSQSSLHYGRLYFNSVVTTIASLAGVVLLGAAGGYSLAHFKYPGRKLARGTFLTIMTFPVAAVLIPLFIMEFRAGIQDTLFGLILPMISFNLPFVIFIMYAVYMGIPAEIADSAEIDGCNQFRTWWQIMLPLSSNAILVVLILYFGNLWGAYALPVVLATSSRAMTLPVGLMMLQGEQWDYSLMSAIILVAMLPSVLVFLVFRRYFASGISLGGVKG